MEGPERRRGTGTDRDRKRLLRPCSDRRPGPQDSGGPGSSLGPTGTCFQTRSHRPSAQGHGCPPTWDTSSESGEGDRRGRPSPAQAIRALSPIPALPALWLDFGLSWAPRQKRRFLQKAFSYVALPLLGWRRQGEATWLVRGIKPPPDSGPSSSSHHREQSPSRPGFQRAGRDPGLS